MLTKKQRLAKIAERMTATAPFQTGAEVRMALEEIMKDVEDEFSGVPENPNAAIASADGRMYPPDDKFEIHSDSPNVRIFKQRRHRTSIGNNGAILVESSDGHTLIDIPGADGRRVNELFQETRNESDRAPS